MYSSYDVVYMPTISARISEEELSELETTAEVTGHDRSETIREALEVGLRELRLREAVGRYQQGELSTNEAARLAGVSVAEWLTVARERNLTTQLTAADLRDDADGAMEL